MLRIHPPPEGSRRKASQVWIDGRLQGAVVWGRASDFDAGRGHHLVTIGGGRFHSKSFEFEDKGETVAEIECGPAPGGFVAVWYTATSMSIWRALGDFTGVGI